ncbi:hypothetical protein Tco_0862676 [Tanacetum coccineum]
MEAGSSTMVTAAKLPLLNPEEFELWKIRIEAPRENKNREPIQVSDKFKTGYDSQVSDSQVNDKYKTCEGYHAVPPPYTRNFMPPKPDLILADEYIFNLISDSEDEYETESKQRKPSYAIVKFVKSNEHVKSPRESVKKIDKQAKYPRKNSQSPKGNK